MQMKIKKIWQNKIFKNYFLLLGAFILIEVLFRILGHINKFNYSILRIIIGLNILSLLLSFIFSLLPKKIHNGLNVFIVFLASFYSAFELGFYNFFGVYASIQTKSQFNAVKAYIKDFLNSFNWTFYFCFIPFLIILLYYIFIDKKVSHELPKRKLSKNIIIKKVLLIFTIFILFGAYYSTLKLKFMQNKLQTEKPYNLFIKPTNPSLVVSEFGILGFSLLDIKEAFFPGPDTYDLNVSLKEFNNEFILEEHINIDNLDWLEIINENDELIGEENTDKNLENYNVLNKYFISNDSTTSNEYTGIFKDKNLIVIMLESVNDIILNKEYYPNIYKLANEGWNFSNNYSPRNSCNTMNNEFSGITSLYSIYNNCTANVYKNNTYFNSIFNLFNNKGYLTNSFHNNYDEFYDRNSIHLNMGSSKYYDIDSLNIASSYRYADWASDVELMESYLDVIDKRDDDKPFMSWITTVSSHQPYTNNCKYCDIYSDLFLDTYPSILKNYMSKLKVVDDAIGLLIEGLEDRGLLSDTVIVLYGDHYPYAIDGEKLNLALDYDTLEDNNIDQVPFIIYNPNIEHKEFKEYTSYINILPTIANLFALDYDSRLFMGSDLFSDEYQSLVLFADGSWKNEYGFYNASNGNIKFYQENAYNTEEILAINDKLGLKLKMSSLAIRTNYFDYLFDVINSDKTVDTISDIERKD